MTTQTIDAIDDQTMADLRAVPIERGRPLVAVDCDEVMVSFAGHLIEWLPSTGHEMRLTEYRLEGSMFPEGSNTPIPFDDCIVLLDRFFHEETTRQRAIPGAVEALERLSREVQVVILTNAPRFARAARAVNVRDLGMDYPLVVNSGGKGRALEWLRLQAGAPVAFVDDSPQQLTHAAKHAPEVTRIHFVGAPHVNTLLRESPEADHRAQNWAEAEEEVRAALL